MRGEFDCQEARRVLWPVDAPQISDRQVDGALEHAQSCQRCGWFLENDRRVATLVRDSVPRAEAPRELRERLYTVLARERAGSGGRWADRRRAFWKLGAAVMIGGLVLAAAGHWLSDHRGAPSPAAEFAEDYLRRVVEQEALVTSDREEIGAFFARELGISAEPPSLPGFDMRRAVICLMNGRRGGVVEYTSGGRTLSYYVIPDGEGDSDPMGELDARRIERRSKPTATAEARGGLGVATWRDGEHQHALVGNLPPEELEELAPLFASPAARL